MKLHPLAAAVAALALALPATAAAEGGLKVTSIGLQVQSFAGGKATGVVQCVPGEYAGKTVSLTVDPGVDTSALAPGALVGVSLDNDRHISAVQPSPPCTVSPIATDDQPEDGDQPEQGDQPEGVARPQQAAQPQRDDAAQPAAGKQQQGRRHRLLGAFTSRVWKLSGDADGFANGRLSMTIGKVLNLPKRFAAQDDDLLDADATVLVAPGVRVYDATGKRTTQSALDDAESVLVQGKILPVAKWQSDEDGDPVPTIRAKRVTVTA